MLWSPLDEKFQQSATQGPALDPPSYHANTITAAYYHHSAALPRELLQPLVYNALSRVIVQIPSMVTILPHAVQIIQLRDGRDEEVDVLVEEQRNMRFPELYEKVPCWRLVIAYTSGRSTVSDMVACFVVGEPASDQLCGMDFHRSFSAALLLVNKAKLSKQPSEYPSAKHSKRYSTSRQEKQTNHTQRHSQFKSVTLGTTDTARLLVDCFANKTNITCAMQAVLAASLFSNLSSEFTTLRSAGRISPSGTIEHTIAIPCSEYITTHNRAQGWHMTSIWNEAQRIHTAYNAEPSGKVRSNSLMGFLHRERGYTLCDTKDISETSGVSVGVSSMGSFQNSRSSQSEKQQEWQTGRMMSSSDSNEINAALSVTLVVGGDGCLTIGFSWLDGDIEDFWLDKVVVNMRRLIGELLNTNGATKTETVPWGGSVSRLVCMVRDLMLE
ncbi:hypothetical protein PEX1_063630 [Penicillium expansum]|uniref:Alcohol acetyltransferase n=1 Tax=Penicillium expansum TaxID=27334 RepID=A0A0A2IY40_PENEN|nr:hypothetical protein PEX2_034120 [Penicillium expansum]KGO45065.1 hypothetical protein PEXP_090950 [Penicillium expansum]KGO55699.1 hypothetical protein PEX1_063630 [Penicillium expansum]KGO60234.1 hypothetical protein PEX2_034120 [Penicillium expansum]